MRACVSIVFVACALASLAGPCEAKASRKPKPIPIEYAAPTNPDHQAIHETLKTNRVLEKFQNLFRIFPMSKPFGFRFAGCDGEANAWYDPDDRMITVCYEYVAEAQRLAPKETTPAGVTPDDATLGPVIETFLHEAGHALFDVFRIPILGREEDAADQVAAYALLRLGDEMARRTIGGVAYNLASEAKQTKFDRKTFADEHGLPAQRFFNLVCMAYGAKPKVFSEVVEKDYLPKERAESCEQEYEQVAYAISTLLGPHMDKAAAAELKAKLKTWKPAAFRKPRPQ